MTVGTLHAIATVLAVLALIAVSWWAYSPANRKRFEQDGLMVLNDDPLLENSKAKQSDSIDSVSRENP